MSDVVTLERRGGVALITLNRPQARNAIDAELSRSFVERMAEAQDAGCIVITGADPAFCAGLDLRNPDLDRGPTYPQALQDSQVPTIAAVNGPAVTGGFEIALGCDFIVASERAAFADTHVRVGVYPGPVLVDLPRRVGMAKAREMSMTGNFVGADEALRIGLVNHVKPHGELLPFVRGLAAAIAEQDPRMIRAMRADWDESGQAPLDEAREIHARHMRAWGPLNGSDVVQRREAVLARSKAQRE
jgi:enoyl-CoA hydratase